MIPGRIQSYDKDSRTATVKPSVRQRTLHGELLDIPPIAGIPVVWPSSGAFSLVGDLALGDGVMLVFAETSIGSWIKGSGDADAEDETRFSLHDAIAVPGLWARSKVPSTHDLRKAVWGLASQSVTIGASNGGLVVVQNATTDLRTELDKIWDAITTLRTNSEAEWTALAGGITSSASFMAAAASAATANAAIEAAALPGISVSKAELGELLV